MTNYKTSLLKKEVVAEGTIAFHFTKPSGFKFKAGQHIDLTEIDPPQTDAEGKTRTFSLACSPNDKDLVIATRMRPTAFKNVLKDLPEGSELEFAGPFGSMTLHNDTSKTAVLLAGGIGITPFLGMIRQAAQEKLPHKIILFYSNRRPQDAAFFAELLELQKNNPNFTLIATMTQDPEWAGEKGHIDEDMLRRHIPDLNQAIFYVAGPPNLTQALHDIINQAGINDDYIKGEDFAGY